MRRIVLVLVFALAACDPPAPTQTPVAAASHTASASPAAPTQNVDVRVEFEKTSDAYDSYISGFLDIPAMGVHLRLFTVPFPYECMRGETDASDALDVECRGDDGFGSAMVRVEGGHVIATANDYGRIRADKTVKDLALPPGSTATLFAPAKFPGAH